METENDLCANGVAGLLKRAIHIVSPPSGCAHPFNQYIRFIIRGGLLSPFNFQQIKNASKYSNRSQQITAAIDASSKHTDANENGFHRFIRHCLDI